MPQYRYIQFTTVHPRTDPRIRIKEASSIARNFSGGTALFVLDGKGYERDPNGFDVVDVGKVHGGRIARLCIGGCKMAMAIIKANPRVAHFHDPELALVGLVLKLFGIKVFYDVHEDLPKQIMSKPYIPDILKSPTALFVKALERFFAFVFDGVVLAGETLSPRFPSHKSVVVHNYPLLKEFSAQVHPDQKSGKHFVYVGGLTEKRGALTMLDALHKLDDTDIKLILAGNCQPASLLQQLQNHPAWGQVEYLGWVGREGISTALQRASTGLVTLHPEPNYLQSYPTKMYEYMAASLPIIASDFKFWRNILSGYDCALFVDPCDSTKISEAMHFLLKNPGQAKAMGQAGFRAMREKFSWEQEERLLIAFYKQRSGCGDG